MRRRAAEDRSPEMDACKVRAGRFCAFHIAFRWKRCAAETDDDGERRRSRISVERVLRTMRGSLESRPG